MGRVIFTYGLISGAVIILFSIFVLIGLNGGQGHHGNLFLGYLVMIVGLSSIFVAVRQYRNERLGGVIRFWPALKLGLGIAIVASLVYVAIWEVYMAATHYTFMDNYTAQLLADKRAAGVTGAAYQQAAKDMEAMRANYANPFFRMAETFAEIMVPVGLLIPLISAALLRNPRFLPAKAAVA